MHVWNPLHFPEQVIISFFLDLPNFCDRWKNMNPYNKLKELGIELPQAAKPLASYVPSVRTGNLVFISGNLPFVEGKLLFEGLVPDDVSVEDGYICARQAAINIMAALHGEIGDLRKVRRIIRLNGFVASGDDFTMQPKVINGASDLFVEVFGDAGKHSRAVMGVNRLPVNSPVEIDAIIEVVD
jgi:enamine deaminase RidA (YjgF/YER057c/UK114 family)